MSKLTTLTTLVGLLTTSTFSHAIEPAPLTLDQESIQRLGIEIATLKQPSSLTLATAAGKTAVEAVSERQLMMPFAARVESWRVPARSHVSAGTALVDLHSHDALAFLQQNRRLQASAQLCDERLGNLRERQRSGISSRLDVQEKSLECQQFNDELQVNGEVLAHLPSSWHNSTKAEFTLSAAENGWLIETIANAGQMADEQSGLARFWPDSALRVQAAVSPQLASQLRQGQTLNMISSANGQTVVAVLQRISAGINASGLVDLWLQPQEATLVPGQRWRVELQSAEHGWVVPASARVRLDGQSWVFVQQGDQVLPVAVEPIAEGSGQLLLTNQQLANQAVVTHGTAALSALWQSIGGE